MADGIRTAPKGSAAEELRRRLLDIVVKVIALTTPFTYAIFAFELWRGNRSPLMWIYLAMQVVGPTSVLLTRKDVHLGGKVVIVYVSAMSVVTTFTFGPLLGTGAMLVAASMLAIIFVSVRAMILVQLSVIVTTVFATQYSRAEFEQLVWYRATITYLIVTTGLAFIVDRTLRFLESENEKLVASLEREREEREARQQADLELAHTRRLESLGRLAGGIAHDVNNGLTVILGNAQYAKRLSGEPVPDEVIDDILAAANSSRDTIARLMLLGRQKGEEEGQCDPNAVVGRLSKTLAKLMPENVEVSIQCLESEGGYVGLAASSLEQILLNLVINAKDAMPSGGELEIIAGWKEEDWSLQVRDTGQGMDQETAQRAFEPFYTTKDIDKGTGLGLSMVDAHVRAAGGEVQLESEVGKGTIFEIRLPACELQTNPASEELVDDESVTPLRILVVEDEYLVRRSLLRLLARDGHELSEAQDEASAVRRLDENEFDLVITDCVMPKTQISRLVDAIEDKQPQAKIILCSGWTSEDGEKELAAGRVAAFVRKPFDMAELRKSIDLAMDRADPATAPRATP